MSVKQKSDVNTFLDKILNKDSELFNSWTKAVCLYSSKNNVNHEFLKEISQPNAGSDDLIMEETKKYILSGLKPV